MKKTFRKLLIYGTVLAVCGCRGAGQRETWEKEFADPSDIYRPQPFWHINGTLTTEGIRKQLSDAIQGDGFGGVAILPLNPGGMWAIRASVPARRPFTCRKAISTATGTFWNVRPNRERR